MAPEPVVVGVTSARPDGATSTAIGLAATLAAKARTLIIDLNLERGEVADILDLASDRNLYHLAYIAQLGPLQDADLDQHIGWRDGLACIPGVVSRSQATLITDLFLRGLMVAASNRFDAVILDLGRLRADLPLVAESTRVLLAVTPNRLGLSALDSARTDVAEQIPELWRRLEIVTTRTSAFTAPGAAKFFQRAYEMSTVGRSPMPAPSGEMVGTHSLRHCYVA